MANITVKITSGATFTIPADFGSVISINCYGPGGGGGGSQLGAQSGNGGGGGAFAQITGSGTLAANGTANIQIGTGGAGGAPNSNGSDGSGTTWFRIDGGAGAPANTTQGVLADFGRGGPCTVSSSAGGVAGSTANSIGTTTFAGGTGGGLGANPSGQAGGAGAGPNGKGGNGGVTNPTGNVGAGGGGGGNGGANGNNGSGATPGTGGAGNAGGGNGGDGGGAGTQGTAGAAGTEFTITAGGTAGAGGGGGGEGTISSAGNAGGLYGGGGGGCASTGSNTGGAGRDGVIIFVYSQALAGTEIFVDELTKPVQKKRPLPDAVVQPIPVPFRAILVPDPDRIRPLIDRKSQQTSQFAIATPAPPGRLAPANYERSQIRLNYQRPLPESDASRSIGPVPIPAPAPGTWGNYPELLTKVKYPGPVNYDLIFTPGQLPIFRPWRTIGVLRFPKQGR